MNFWGNQAVRLVRGMEGWTADALAEELVSIFTSFKDGIPGPLRIKQTDDQPFIIFDGFNPGDFTIQGGSGDNLQNFILEVGPVFFDTGGGSKPKPPPPTTLLAVVLDGEQVYSLRSGKAVFAATRIETEPDTAFKVLPGTAVLAVSTPSGIFFSVPLPNCMMGKIKSGGPGATYRVTVFPNGPNKPGMDVTVQQLQIDVAEVIPVDTIVMVNRAMDGSFSMQVPVWL